ncbi:MAG: 5'-nucleotidase, partial [Psychrobacter alimentarius]
FAPHIFFDDSIKHIDAARDFIPTALVPYHSTSLLHGDSYLTPDKDATLMAFEPVERPLFTTRH